MNRKKSYFLIEVASSARFYVASGLLRFVVLALQLTDLMIFFFSFVQLTKLAKKKYNVIRSVNWISEVSGIIVVTPCINQANLAHSWAYVSKLILVWLFWVFP